MSMQQKLRAAATAAALEATANERARCLWCAEQVIAELKAKLAKKILSAANEHASQLKIQIAGGVVMELRRAIISGARPAELPRREVAGGTGQTGAADLSPPEG